MDKLDRIYQRHQVLDGRKTPISLEGLRLRLGENECFIDLFFYHRFLEALVAVELKLGPFEPEFAGKMDFYQNVLNENERAVDDNASIGIVLCAQKNDAVAFKRLAW